MQREATNLNSCYVSILPIHSFNTDSHTGKRYTFICLVRLSSVLFSLSDLFHVDVRYVEI